MGCPTILTAIAEHFKRPLRYALSDNPLYAAEWTIVIDTYRRIRVHDNILIFNTKFVQYPFELADPDMLRKLEQKITATESFSMPL